MRYGSMKCFIYCLLGCIFLAMAPALRAQESAQQMRERAAEADMQRQELFNLESETVRAIQWNSTAFFRRVYSDDFIGIAGSGEVMDKQKYLIAVQSSPIKYSSFIASDIRVRIYQETAVVSCLWSAHGTVSGHSVSWQYRVTHIYINGTRGWQAVSSQETLLPG
jgi:hypothetical protein